MSELVSFVCSEPDRRLDALLTSYMTSYGSMPVSRAQVAKWILAGHVEVDRRVEKKPSVKVPLGKTVSCRVPDPVSVELEPDPNVDFEIVYEDEDLLVVNKPAGLTVHTGAGQQTGTLVNGLLHRVGSSLVGIGDELRPGIVHRLDKDTSGLMVVAKSSASHFALSKQFLPPRSISRKYLLFTRKLPKVSGSSLVDDSGFSGSIHLGIGRHPNDRLRMLARSDFGKPAVTHWRVLESYTGGYLIEASLETGRTHQIRVHFEATGAPLIGDPVYGESWKAFPSTVQKTVRELGRQALHAYRLDFVHPRSERVMEFEISLPDDLELLRAAMGKGS